MKNRACIIVFAKAPVPGTVKTRLSPPLDPATAAFLHAALVERSLEIALAAGLDHTELCCAPDADHPFFGEVEEDFGIALGEQGEGDLGQRMLRALTRAHRHFAAALIIGADCPALSGAHIAAAAGALTSHDVVLTPAEDGGYVLIGARRTHPAMFDAIDWGTATVLEQQRRALSACALSSVEMPMLWDVDRPADLARLKTLKPPLAFTW